MKILICRDCKFECKWFHGWILTISRPCKADLKDERNDVWFHNFEVKESKNEQ
jgi:hypothetical protein